MNKIIEKAFLKHELQKEEIIKLLENDDINGKLFSLADKTRQEYVGDEIHLRALIEFTNICAQNCLYCGLRRDNKNIERYRLTPEKIINLSKNAAKLGYKTIVLQGGEDSFYKAEKIAPIITEIKKLNIAVTLSIGEMEEDDYKTLKVAGADRFLLRIETSNSKLYKKFHPDMNFQHRLNCLKTLKKLGFETGTGILVGLPGQTNENLADDILFFKKINADMVGLGPLIINKDTPLKNQSNGNLIKSLKVLAITRLLMPDINIPATTAMETLHKNGRIMALKAGANVIMPNVGDYNERKLYNLYPGKVFANEETDVSYEKIVSMINSIGRCVSKDLGFRKH